MAERDTPAGEIARHRFLWLLIALVILLLAYPHFRDTTTGAMMGGLTSLLLLVTGVHALQTNRFVFAGAIVLAVAAGSGTVITTVAGIRGHQLVEASYSVFYAYTTICVFVEVVRTRVVTRDTILGIICVYLLIGVTFGTLYDFLETVHPGSFQVNVDAPDEPLGWRTLIFYSFMTLTTVGYGDVTPLSHEAQSLAILEGVIGVLYVAVLIARIVGAYRRAEGEEARRSP